MKTKIDWQPIETAPLDGTRVLLWYPDTDEKVFSGYYVNQVTLRNGIQVQETSFWVGEPQMWLHKPLPTHWAPMLDRPAAPDDETKIFLAPDVESGKPVG